MVDSESHLGHRCHTLPGEYTLLTRPDCPTGYVYREHCVGQYLRAG
jgi:hypothetical protein